MEPTLCKELKKVQSFINIALHEIPPDHSCWYTRFELQLYISVHKGGITGLTNLGVALN